MEKKEKEFNRGKYEKLLKKRGVKYDQCDKCKKKEFVILDGYTFLPFSVKQKRGRTDKNVPAILVICDNCGAITPHAIGAFGEVTNKEENGT